MPIEFIEFEEKKYPKFQSEGNAARWIRPLAEYYCKGSGLDIGYSRPDWQFPGSIGIDLSPLDNSHAMLLPARFNGWDYIHSSHCLEHIKENWQTVLDYWFEFLKPGGILFLYLPHISQKYWNTRNNKKHVHQFSGEEIWDYITSQKYFGSGFKSGPDFNNSFVVVIEKS